MNPCHQRQYLFTKVYTIFSCIVVISVPSVFSASDHSIVAKVHDVLHQLKVWQELYDSKIQSRPFVTATFAQSIDGYLALTKDPECCDSVQNRTSSNYPLSGHDSLLLTHALRSIHDGILIGGRTLSIDNPRLTNRLWMFSNETGVSSSGRQPRPIVLDTNLLHMRVHEESLKLRNPIFCCSHSAFASLSRMNLSHDMSILPCLCNADGSLNILDVLQQLRNRYSIRTIMVEGGAMTLSSFFKANAVDSLVITIAPKIFHRGIAPTFTETNQYSISDVVDLQPSQFVVLGSDVVLISRYFDAVRTAT